MIGRIIRGFFKPSWQPPQGDGLTHGSWKRGDLAVCISTKFQRHEDGHSTPAGRNDTPANGQVVRVCHVDFDFGFHSLRFDEFPNQWFDAQAFRKAHLDTAEACERDFAKLLRRSKPRVDA